MLSAMNLLVVVPIVYGLFVCVGTRFGLVRLDGSPFALRTAVKAPGNAASDALGKLVDARGKLVVANPNGQVSARVFVLAWIMGSALPAMASLLALREGSVVTRDGMLMWGLMPASALLVGLLWRLGRCRAPAAPGALGSGLSAVQPVTAPELGTSSATRANTVPDRLTIDVRSSVVADRADLAAVSSARPKPEPQGEARLAHIAAMKKPLNPTSKWTQYVADDGGPYFVHDQTRESKWELPLEGVKERVWN
jgi:hypothetical protein